MYVVIYVYSNVVTLYLPHVGKMELMIAVLQLPRDRVEKMKLMIAVLYLPHDRVGKMELMIAVLCALLIYSFF